MVDISHEHPVETEVRLRRVLKTAEFAALSEAYIFSPIGSPAHAAPDALATVRYQDAWCELRPRTNDDASEAFFLWRFAFPGGGDNSGFVGWLASYLKAKTGSGVFVTCGSHPTVDGVYDYWGCPIGLRDDMLETLKELTVPTIQTPSLEGRIFKPVERSETSIIDADTHLVFSEHENGRVKARYAGGSILEGHIIGHRNEDDLTFAFLQVDRTGSVQSGQSVCRIDYGTTLRIEENFYRGDYSGCNLFEEVTLSCG